MSYPQCPSCKALLPMFLSLDDVGERTKAVIHCRCYNCHKYIDLNLTFESEEKTVLQ